MIERLQRSLRGAVGALRDARHARRLIRDRRVEDERRAAQFEAENLAEIARTGDTIGAPGWLIRTERTYAPTRDRYRAANSRLSPRRRLVNSGGDKMSLDRNGYAPAYSQLLARWVGSPVVLVELGAFRGSGLALWSDLFPAGTVVGLDVELDHFEQNLPQLLERGAFRSGVPDVLRFDAFAPDVTELTEALEGRPIDVLIDDGPHKEEPSCLTAARIRPLLAPRFTYVIEDCDEIYACLADTFAGCSIRREARGLVVITAA